MLDELGVHFNQVGYDIVSDFVSSVVGRLVRAIFPVWQFFPSNIEIGDVALEPEKWSQKLRIAVPWFNPEQTTSAASSR